MARGYRFSLFVSLLVCFGCYVGAPARTQNPQAGFVQHITLGESTVPLYGPWKFAFGDSPIDPVNHEPVWAEPDFDDSKWETVDLRPQDKSVDSIYGVSGMVPGWTVRGHARGWGYAWYRMRVQVTARPGEQLALAGPPAVDDAYQVLQDGSLVGSFGGFSSKRPVVFSTQPMMFALPQPSGIGSTTRLLAFRVWMDPYTLRDFPDVGGLRTAPLLGEAGVVATYYKLLHLEEIRTDVHLLVLTLLFGVVAIAAFSLILFDRSDGVYFWLGATFLLTAVYDGITVFVSTTQHLGIAGAGLIRLVILRPLIYGAWVMVWWTWFRLQRPWWLPRAVAILAVVYAVSSALHLAPLVSGMPHPVGASFDTMSLVVRLLFLLFASVCVIEGIRREGLEGWSVLPAVILWGVSQFTHELSFLHIRVNWYPFGVEVTLQDVANVLLLGVIAGLLLRRLMVTVRRQRLMELDVRQAREVQRVILPEPIASVPGLTIASEYRPAREVGGDFFQMIPHPSDRSLLIVAGDVTGKGLQAGMLVALLVGAIRTSAQFDPDPLAVLNVLNERLCGRSEAAATCLALRVAANGDAKLANAGHLPPYLNGEPLEIAGSLPLGLTEGVEFTVLQFRLEEGDCLMLMSDGIPEATDVDGKLFGFDRVHALLRDAVSPVALATAAQSFGQQDDISVIAITRTAALVT